MVLIDTSVWISHFRLKNIHLVELLLDGGVMCHPLVLGELALGNLKNRHEILTLLHVLPHVTTAEHEEILDFIELHRLAGSGIGLIDVHLLASAFLTNTALWTTDRKLREAAASLNIMYSGRL